MIAKAVAVTALVSLASTMSATAATFVYVSNAEDGDIATYRLDPAVGEVTPGERVKAGNLAMPMAVSPDRKFLYVALRSKPFTAITYAIDPASGALKESSRAPLADNFAYISLDKTGRYLFGASYSSHLVSVNAIDAEGHVATEPAQIVPIGRNAHSIRTDSTNRFAYVPSLGSDQVFEFTFDEKAGRLASNTPAVALLKPQSGPRHYVISSDNRFLYLLNELQGSVTTFAIDASTGLLTEMATVSGLPPDTKLGPGFPRGAIGAANAPPPRNTDNDIWAADIHMTPNGKFLFISERTNSTLSTLGVDGQTGKVTYLGVAATEKQPRGFAIDPRGRFLIASGEKSDTISVYGIDQRSGALRLLGKYPAGKGANWVEIVSFD